MKYLTGIVALLAFAMLVAPVLAIEPASGSVSAGAAPGNSDPDICVDQRMVGIMSREGGTINNCAARVGQYAFEGETINYKVMVRDPNGVNDIGNLHITVDTGAEVLCVAAQPEPNCDGLTPYDPATDKWFVCRYTVEPTDPTDAVVVSLVVYDALNVATGAIYTENFVFNPALSLDVSVNTGESIAFEDGQPGECVHSTNKLLVENTAAAGVNMWMFLAGTDLTDPSGTSLCPVTNEIDITGAAGQPGTGMFFQGTSGTLQNTAWTQMAHYDDTMPCVNACGPALDTCYGGLPVPLAPPGGNLLTNGAQMEIAFKLCYPIPCIGSFSRGTIYVYGLAI